MAANYLTLLRDLPYGILLLHQANTIRGRSRAHGPLPAIADILIDMHKPSSDPFTRRRHITGVGRYPGTLDHVSAELNPEGTDYIVLPDAAPEPALAPALETLQLLLSQSANPLTRHEILARWPASDPPPRPDTLWRTLTRGCDLGLFTRTGAGNRAEAFRYGLAQMQSATAG